MRSAFQSDPVLVLAILLATLATAGCTSEAVSPTSDTQTAAVDVPTAAPSDAAGADAPAVVDSGPAPTVDTPVAWDPGPPPPLPDTSGEVPEDVPSGSCVCDTATSIEWNKAASHSSCSKPSPAKFLSICNDAKTKVFESGDTFGVKGCKFVVTC